ncbi:MAG TPA: glycoside hydrolase family 2 protein [Parafilimonas sp.]|nr:glycoside hydrolase family 2 protein [Parafilimonas sp.]
MKTFFFFLSLIFIQQSFGQNRTENFQMILHDDWRMQSSTADKSTGAQISQKDFSAKGWYKISVPSTIIAGLLSNNEYNFDPFYGKNFEKLADKRMDHPWWFRKEFDLPASEKDKNVILKLHGINYKANVWLNGVKIADSSYIKGPFRIIELDVSKQIKYDGRNVLALQIVRPFNPNKHDGDLAIDYADWIHYPPDYNGGIVNNVEIKTYDRVGVRYPLVTTKFDLPSLDVAHLTVDAEVVNYTDKEKDAVVKGKINDDLTFEQQVHLMPNEIKQVTFTPAQYPQLNVKNPRIWWPWQYGEPQLNRIEISIVREGNLSNTVSENFGIREIDSKLINDHSREFIVNGKPIMLRGAAWSPDIFQRHSAEREEQELRLVRDMNMNIVRSEGKLEDDNFYDLCDKYGLLVMTGWMCCGAWQYPENWNGAERAVAMASDSSVMYWLRNKACVMVWLNGSDMPPRDPSVESDYLSIEKYLKWPNPTISTADASESKVSGYSGVKINGPYDWVPPIYWETDSNKYGGSWSFATEISPGPSIPPYESLIKFIPKDSMWYTNSVWQYHCGTMQFGNTKIFDNALNQRYGKSSSINEYLAKAQLQNYEGHRAMMEAYGLNKYNTATGVVQWMLCNPWPSLIWHTYDYYLYPAGTYFGMKKSMESLHVMYSYKSNEVDIINCLLQRFSGLTVKADVYNLDGTVKYSNTVSTDVEADGTKHCFAIPQIAGLSATYFLRLELKDAKGATQSINWYWLSQKQDALRWQKSEWYYTPQSDFSDFTALSKMPKSTLDVKYASKEKENKTEHTITITNTGKAVAFFVHVRALKDKNADDILPVIFSDNYISLAPGESRTIECRYENKYAGSASPYILTSAWNLDVANSKAENNAGFEK